MNKTKISVLTWIAVFFTIIGSVIPQIYIHTISEGYALYYGLPPYRLFMGSGFLFSILGFLLGIGGIIIEVKNKNIKGRIICIICMLLNFNFIGYCFSMEGAAYERTRRISCASNIKQIHLSLKQYAMDYSGNFPPANGAAGLEYLRKYDYLTDYAIFTCPSSLNTKGTGTQPLTEDIVDYVYVGGLNEKSDPNFIILS